jgi:hypothetical protein
MLSETLSHVSCLNGCVCFCAVIRGQHIWAFGARWASRHSVPVKLNYQGGPVCGPLTAVDPGFEKGPWEAGLGTQLLWATISFFQVPPQSSFSRGRGRGFCLRCWVASYAVRSEYDISFPTLEFLEYQTSSNQKSSTFRERKWFTWRPLKFLTLIINLHEEDFVVAPVSRKAAVPRCCVCETVKLQLCFMTLTFGNSPGSDCSHNVLNKFTSHQHYGILTRLLLVKHLFLTCIWMLLPVTHR